MRTVISTLSQCARGKSNRRTPFPVLQITKPSSPESITDPCKGVDWPEATSKAHLLKSIRTDTISIRLRQNTRSLFSGPVAMSLSPTAWRWRLSVSMPIPPIPGAHRTRCQSVSTGVLFEAARVYMDEHQPDKGQDSGNGWPNREVRPSSSMASPACRTYEWPVCRVKFLNFKMALPGWIKQRIHFAVRISGEELKLGKHYPGNHTRTRFRNRLRWDP